ncbi:hypothetical protein TCCBUS3UF1_2250 [Thermus sp. CCB_US3_UF1]|nr:hypothetical protein TCCBUS3UF1_2250 [Thermus sp. CCB_US3_UF1]
MKPTPGRNNPTRLLPWVDFKEILGAGLYSYEEGVRHPGWEREWSNPLRETEEDGFQSFAHRERRPFPFQAFWEFLQGLPPMSSGPRGLCASPTIPRLSSSQAEESLAPRGPRGGGSPSRGSLPGPRRRGGGHGNRFHRPGDPAAAGAGTGPGRLSGVEDQPADLRSRPRSSGRWGACPCRMSMGSSRRPPAVALDWACSCPHGARLWGKGNPPPRGRHRALAEGPGRGILWGITTEERLLKLEGIVEAVVRLLPERKPGRQAGGFPAGAQGGDLGPEGRDQAEGNRPAAGDGKGYRRFVAGG